MPMTCRKAAENFSDPVEFENGQFLLGIYSAVLPKLSLFCCELSRF
jgi:hypothetical protein